MVKPKIPDCSLIVYRMDLNLSPEFILSTIGSIPLLISSVALILRYRTTRDKILGYLSLAWFFFFLALFIDGLSYLLLNEFLFRFKFLFILLIGIFSIMAVDLMELQKIRPWSISLATFLGTLTLGQAFISENVFFYTGPDGFPSIGSQGYLRYFSTVTTLFYASYFFFFSYKLWQVAEGKYKRITGIHLIGILIYGPITFSAFLFGATFKIPGIHALLIGFGALLSAMSLARYPEIMYIIPFKVGSLNFVAIGSGLVPFRYQWNRSADLEIDGLLFGSLFEAFRQFSNEAFPFGSIEEIVYEKGVLYVAPNINANFLIILIANRKSETLRQNLQSFAFSVGRIFVSNKMNIHKLLSEEKEKLRELVISSFPLIPNFED